jgi:hypothetical protein
MPMMAGLTENKIAARPKFICDKINYHHGEECFIKDIARIKEVFPKLLENDGFYHIEGFDTLHNQVGYKAGISYSEKKDILFPSQNKSKSKIKNKSICATAPVIPDFITTLKTNVAYKHVDIDRELGKMDAWLAMPRNKGRQKTQRFILNWLNKVDVPIEGKPKMRTIS